jgi:hypothetical protein
MTNKKNDDSKVIDLFDSPMKLSRFETSMEIWKEPGQIDNAIFQHSVFCQSYFPYRKLPDEVRIWRQSQGNVSLNVQTLDQEHPKTGEMIHFGVPFGTKARLITAYLNTQAIKTSSPVIDVESSMTSFIQAIGLATKGKNFIEVKDQLARIASSVISLNFKEADRVLTTRFLFVKTYDLWFPKDERQRVLWMPTIQLTDDYFNELAKHAVPLDERALGALKNNAMALDIYSWLAQRLHRVPRGKPQFITWVSLKEQFGMGYERMDKFKAVFRTTLAIVHTQYMGAKIREESNKGYWLENSPSPIEKKTMVFLGNGKE